MGKAYGMYGERRGVHMILAGKPDGKITMGRQTEIGV